jgi:hypothetical protein
MRTITSMRLLAGTSLIVFVYFTGLIVWGTPVWDTNDDVAMAMVAHGYGFVAQKSPNLLFSNVVWGHVVQALHGMFACRVIPSARLVAWHYPPGAAFTSSRALG